MMVPIQLDTPHVVERMFDIHPSVGKWEMVGEGGSLLGDEGDSDMVGGEEG